jgi:transposase
MALNLSRVRCIQLILIEASSRDFRAWLDLDLMAKGQDAYAYHLLRSIPGVGRILTLVLLYEIEHIGRFPRVQEFLSYARLVKCQKGSAGKVLGHIGKKIGNVHLK